MKLQFFSAEPLDIYDTEWHQLTKINYRYQGRKVFSNRKKELVHNPFFPKEELEGKFYINAYYIRAINRKDGDSFTSDFHLGFNNIDRDIEERLIIELIEDETKAYAVISQTLYDRADMNKLEVFNPNNQKYIANQYEVLFASFEHLEYVVRLQREKQITELNDFIKGYLIKPTGINIKEVSKLMPLDDVDVIDKLTDCFETVVIRAGIYANYNFVVYSKINLAERLKKGVQNICERNHILFEIGSRRFTI